MTKGSDNDFPSILLSEQGSAPASPAAGKQRAYIRTSDHTLVTVNSSGTVASIGGGGGGLVFLEAHTASASATLDFTTFISATYDTYLFEFVSIVAASNSVNFAMRMGTGAGPTWISTGVYSYDQFVFRSGGTGLNGGSALTEIGIDFTGGGDKINNGTAALAGLQGSITLWDPQNTSLYKQLKGSVTYYDAGPFRVGNEFRGAFESTTAVTGVRFLMSSGNIASGTIRVYGYAKS